jgi:hypothetical protein
VIGIVEVASSRKKDSQLAICQYLLLIVSLLMSCACSSTKAIVATEQLLMSDAVDRTVSEFDFRPLSGSKVFLDTAFVVPNRNPQQLINTDYVISSLRQQMFAAGCLLAQNRDEADIVAEVRLGALGTDGQMIIYGVPENNFLSRAASALPNAPQVPTVPEIALAKKDYKTAAAKLAVFAYDRVTLEPVWQSGTVQSESNALDTWVLGVGPFRRGTIQDAEKLVYSRSNGKRPRTNEPITPDDNPLVEYQREWVYSRELPTAASSKSLVTTNDSSTVVATATESGATATTAGGQVTTGGQSKSGETAPTNTSPTGSNPSSDKVQAAQETPKP